ncbi:MAG: hypothetical protein U1E53_00755 [Dongiaceae bacterium]
MNRQQAVTPGGAPPPSVVIGPRAAYVQLRGRPLQLDPGACDRVEPCLYGPCRSDCCSRGAWVDAERRDAIAGHLEAMRPWLAPPWAGLPADRLMPYRGTWPNDRMHPGVPLHATRTAGGRCCFVTTAGDGHCGCAIHKYADAAGLDWTALKPAGCVLFPLKVAVGPAGRVRLFRAAWREVPCCRLAEPGAGERLIDLQRDSVARIFDLDAAALDRLVGPAGTA